MKWIEEGERGEEKKNIEGIKGVEKNLRRDYCIPGSRSHMKNSTREWENLEVWDKDGTVQNEKYSSIGQLGRTGDKVEGEGKRMEGLFRTKPPLIQEVISPLLGNLENVEILRGSRKQGISPCRIVRPVGGAVQLESQESIQT